MHRRPQEVEGLEEELEAANDTIRQMEVEMGERTRTERELEVRVFFFFFFLCVQTK